MKNVLFPELADINGARFSPNRKYRYALWRLWRPNPKRVVAFIGLNGSKADEEDNDNTVRRCIQFAKDWRFDGMYMLNLFGYMATDPEDMKRARKPIGPDNDYYIVKYAKNAAEVIAAWGVHGVFMNRDWQVETLMRENKIKLQCLGLTEAGFPRHPLFLRGDAERMPYPGRKEA